MTIATKFLAKFGTAPLNDHDGMAAIKWLSITDPNGSGRLADDHRTIHYSFSDGSSLILDCATRSFNTTH